MTSSAMVGLSRKSLGAVRFDASEFSSSSTMSPSLRRRSIAVPKIVDSNIEENDDEAERLARREKNEIGSPVSTSVPGNDRRQSFGLSSISNLSAIEMNNQIAQCIKLSAENKINDKNAFQLKMIDFLVYALKKQDPNMSNLQMASASLDASAKIYGFRVDKVHSDLLKIIGMAKQDKRDGQDVNDADGDDNQLDADELKNQQKKKKKKNRQHIISTVQALQGNVETYDPLTLIRCQRDTQTSDMLFQAGLPQHANQGVILNLYNDIILDTVQSTTTQMPKIYSPVIDDFQNVDICPSYAAFKFNGWSPDDEIEEPNKSLAEENDGEFHFDLDAAVDDADDLDHDVMMDCDEAFKERCDRLAINNRTENIVDFQDIIANNPNPNATYEYSYLQKSYRIQWAGPSHWKITMNKNLGSSRVVETCKQNAKKNRKEIELFLNTESKNISNLKFCQVNKLSKLTAKTTKSIWSEDKVNFPQDTYYDMKQFNTFFNKPTEFLKLYENRKNEEIYPNEDNDFNNQDSQDNISFEGNDGDNFGDDDNGLTHDCNPFTQETVIASQGAFVGDNLVSAPKLTDKIFIPYSQRAKKIDMRQLKKVMWKNLKKSSKENEKENFDITSAVENESNHKIEPKFFSNMYLEIPKMLSKPNAESLSPAIAFVSLLHLANEKNLKIDRNLELTDLSINDGKN